jgi:glycosyltransferase involved in cell wall biosynthesis
MCLMLSQITPLILTYNEAPNIAHTMARLTWAKDVVVVDSKSTDETLEELARWPNVRVFTRIFDTLANQWRYAVSDTDVKTTWILRLDADYQLTDKLIEELRALDPEDETNGYLITFDYAVFSRKLRASLYPRRPILLRLGHFNVYDRGHKDLWIVDGIVKGLRGRVIHDDWKCAGGWLSAQSRYMSRELAEISNGSGARLRDRLRLIPPLMPILIFLYCLFGKGLIFDGRAGLFYALQRSIAEAVLSLLVLEKSLRARVDSKLPEG